MMNASEIFRLFATFLAGLFIAAAAALYLRGRNRETEILTARFEEEKNDWTHRLEFQRRELEETRSELREQRATATTLFAENTRLKTDLATQNALVDRFRARCEEYRGQHAELEETYRASERAFHQLRVEHERLKTQTAGELKAERDRIAELLDARQTLSEQFKNLATEILNEKSKVFGENNIRNIDGLLSPLREKIGEFSRLVQDGRRQDHTQRTLLSEELKRLRETGMKLNEDARSLTAALTGGNNKIQGDWGEMTLEKILEDSGLQRDRQYLIQASYIDEDGKRKQPDVLVSLPGNRVIVIDAKVSLTDYVAFRHARARDEEEALLAAHVRSVRRHIRELADKKYQNIEGGIDFVLMFIPVEPAYLCALGKDPTLMNEAYEKNVMLASPSTLLAMLKTVHTVWRYEKQNKNAEEIARAAGSLYDKFVGLAQTLSTVRGRLDETSASFDNAMKQLSEGRGNLLRRVEQLKKLGAKTGKTLPENLIGDDADDEETQTDFPAQNIGGEFLRESRT